MHGSATALIVRADDDARIDELSGEIVQLRSHRVASIIGPSEPWCDTEYTASVVEVAGLILHFDQVSGRFFQQLLLMHAPLVLNQMRND